MLEHESLYRGNDIVANRAKPSIFLAGGGALGSWLVDLLARQGYKNLTVLDFDKVENSNFGTQNFGKSDIGRLKADQIRLNIHKRLGVVVNAKKKRMTMDNAASLVEGNDLVLDLFDNRESRECIKYACEVINIPCVHAGLASMGFFEIKWNEIYKVPPVVDDPEGPCDYPLASNLVMMCVATIAEVVNRFIDSGERFNAEFWLNSGSFSYWSE